MLWHISVTLRKNNWMELIIISNYVVKLLFFLEQNRDEMFNYVYPQKMTAFAFLLHVNNWWAEFFDFDAV